MAIVSMAKAASYAAPQMQAAVQQIFTHFDIAAKIKPDMKVTLKPNLLTGRSPEAAITTHPALIAAVIDQLHALGVQDITLADSPGGAYTAQRLKGVYAASGMETLATQKGIKLNYDVGWQEVQVPNGDICKSFSIINPIANADYIINIAKLKTHAMTTISAGVKNLFGCVPGLQKPELHFRFPEKPHFGRMLVDLAQTVAPSLTLVDAVTAMEGDGPSSGEPRHVGLVFGAEDIYAQDLLLCHLINIPPTAAPMVAAALNRGLCPPTIEDISILGDTQAIQPILNYKKPRSNAMDFSADVPRVFRGLVAYVAKTIASPRPAIINNKCIGCGKCAESCPPKIITITGGKAKIAHANCIKCYCCHEMCPVKAIKIKRLSLLGRL